MPYTVSPLITYSKATSLEGLYRSYYLFETNFLAYHKLWYQHKHWIQVNPPVTTGIFGDAKPSATQITSLQ